MADEWTTRSGIPLEPFYTPAHVPSDLDERIGPPGDPPFARGIHADGYRGEPWIMGQYGGFGTVEETNARLKQMLAGGQTGFSIALDLPTQMGLDSDHELAAGEVGKVGVAIDSLADIEILLDGIDLGRVRQIRTTANAIGHIWLALVVAACERSGTDPASIRVLIQNDVLKEYFARGTYIHPPAAGLSIVADVIEHCARNLPAWTPATLSGYHIREAGADAAQEVAFSIADGIAYCEAALTRGLKIDDFAPSLFTFLSTGIDLLEEVAKFRAARMVWSRVMSERFGAQEPASQALRIFAFTAGSLLRAQQPLNNVARATIEALAAILGGVQTLHTSGYDEALGVPSQEAAVLALRTQQIIAEETSLRGVVDPLGGSWALEALTAELDARIQRLLAEIDERGGALGCIESGWFADELARGAYTQQRAEDSGELRVVGVNCHVDEGEETQLRAFRPDPEGESRQRERTQRVRADRDQDAVDKHLEQLAADASENRNVVPATIAAVRAYATVGEIEDRYTRIDGAWVFQVRRHLLWFGACRRENPLDQPAAGWPESQVGADNLLADIAAVSRARASTPAWSGWDAMTTEHWVRTSHGSPSGRTSTRRWATAKAGERRTSMSESDRPRTGSGRRLSRASGVLALPRPLSSRPPAKAACSAVRRSTPVRCPPLRELLIVSDRHRGHQPCPIAGHDLRDMLAARVSRSQHHQRVSTANVRSFRQRS